MSGSAHRHKNMETISIFVLGQWFFGAFVVTLTVFAPFAVREFQERKLAWICGGLLFATWVGLLVSLAYVWSKGGAVYETDASKVLREKERRLAELAAEVNNGTCQWNETLPI